MANQDKKQTEKPEQTETEEIMQEVKELESIQGSNQHDENKTKAIVDGAIKLAEIRKQKELEIKKAEEALHLEFEKSKEKIQLAQLKYEYDHKIFSTMTDGLKHMATLATVGLIAMTITNNNFAIEMKKIEQGLIN